MLIRSWRPWEKSTGPRSPQGKAKAAMNRYRGGERQQLRSLSKALREMLYEYNSLLGIPH